MEESGWNAHGWIAYPLETIARNELDISAEDVQRTPFSANRIETDTFVEVMFILLRKKKGTETVYSEFVEKCRSLYGKRLTRENKEIASALLEEFKRIIE